MKWEKWYFQSGERYLLSEIIGALHDRLKGGSVIDR